MKQKAVQFMLKTLAVFGALVVFLQLCAWMEGTISLLQLVCTAPAAAALTYHFAHMETRLARRGRKRRAALRVVKAQKQTVFVA